MTQSIKKLPAEDREWAWALAGTGFKRMSDDKAVDITGLSDEDKDCLFYKDEPYTTKKLHQRLIITYSPKYAAYQKEIRQKQEERTEKMVKDGKPKNKSRILTTPPALLARRQ